MTALEVITAWGELTGETWRLRPHSVEAQAAEFCTAGFTRAELELVIAYTRRMIAREEGGFNAQSITWRVMAADRWQKFQERLAAAAKTRLAKRILSNTPTVATVPLPPAITDAEAERLRQQRQAEVAQLKKTIGR